MTNKKHASSPAKEDEGIDTLLKDEQKLEKDIKNRVERVQGQIAHLSAIDDPLKYAEKAMELQAAVGALRAIGRLHAIEQGEKAVAAIHAGDCKLAEKYIVALLQSISQKTTDI